MRIFQPLVAAALGLILAWLAILSALVSNAAWVGASDREGLAALARRLPSNAAYQSILARADLAAGNPQAAASRVEAVLRWNSLSPELWLDLARASIACGRSEEAIEAAAAARRRHPISAAVCHEAAVVFLQARAVSEALEALRCVTDLAPTRTHEVYDLAWAILGDGELIRRAVVPDTVSGWRGYFGYARGSRHEEVSRAWAGLVRHGASSRDRFDYVDFLARLGRGDEASRAWAEEYGARGDNLAFNGSFEADSVGRGLDWVLQPCEDVRTAIVAKRDEPDGDRVLQIVFNGSNVNYQHASQVVPVQGGRRYRLQALVRTDAITSQSRPRLTVHGYGGCPMASVDGRELGGTIPWSEETVSFTIPYGCSAVMVQIRRDRTERFDRKISGRIWIDRVQLTALRDEGA